MGRPHPKLVPLLVHGGAADGDADALVASSLEHRVAGSLHLAVQRGDVRLPTAARDHLAHAHLARRSRAQRQWAAIVELSQRLAALGETFVLLKGVGAGQRWYDAAGERVSTDVDAWCAPDPDRFQRVVRALAPGHPLADSIGDIVRHGYQHGTEVTVAGVTVDLHADVLKLRLPVRSARRWWERRRTVAGPDGAPVAVLAPEEALLHHAIHLNKDRFRYLSGYLDVARIVEREDIDWDRFWGDADAEGLSEIACLAMTAVHEVFPLAVELPDVPDSWRSRVWHRAWRPATRLHGDDAVLRYRHRQDLLPLIARGRTAETLRTHGRQRLLPHAALVDAYYPGQRGPYLVRLATGRARATFRRARARRSA